MQLICRSFLKVEDKPPWLNNSAYFYYLVLVLHMDLDFLNFFLYCYTESHSTPKYWSNIQVFIQTQMGKNKILFQNLATS